MNNRNPKIRRRDYTTDVYDNYDLNHEQNNFNSSELEKVKFHNNETEIVLDRKTNHVITPGRCGLDAISMSLLMSLDYWHSITVHHQGLFTKAEINIGLEDLVDNECFIPIAYRSGRNDDIFYIYNQHAALQSMIRKNLETIVTNKKLKLSLRLGVASYVKGQVNPVEKIDIAMADVISKFRENRLDFSYIDKNRAFVDMQFSLKNKGCFDLFCDRLLHALNLDLNRNLKILVLVGNKIKYLQPLSKLSKCTNLQNLSLKSNCIESLEEFEALKTLSIKSLSIAGNPVVLNNENSIANQIMNCLPALEKLDIKKRTDVPEPPATEVIIVPSKSSEDIIKSTDIDEKFKNEFPRREFTKAFWSKVVIEHNGRFDSKDIFDEMFKTFFEEVPCYICYYTTGEIEDSFMLHMNFDPLNVLVMNDLKMKMSGTNEFVTFRLHLKCSTFAKGEIKWNELIGKVVSKRINSRKLNLSNFCNDPEFKGLIFNMKSPGVRKFVLHCALNKNAKIIEIDLSNNELNSFKGLAIIKSFPELFSLDLSQNNIDSLIGFPDNLKIVELSIGQNPLCNKFKNSLSTVYDYVKTFTTLCPQLQYIDGRKIDLSFKMVHMQNYYATSIAYPTIESFVHFYCKNFDNIQNRTTLLCNALYGEDSILSVSYGNEKGIIKSGNDEIRKYYQSFPYTEHDYITMTVDTPLYNNKNFLIVISGVFKQRSYSSMNEDDKIFTFSRTFMLRKERRMNNRKGRTLGTLSETYNYEIQNEIFHFDILNDSRIKNKAFRKQRATEDEIERALDNKYSAKSEFIANMELFRQTTLLSDEWCRRILEDSSGDFSIALNYFLELYKLQIFRKEDFRF